MKLQSDLYIASVSSWLPGTVSVAEAVEAGLVDDGNPGRRGLMGTL